MSVLDLPVSRQREIALEMGFTDFEEWVSHIRATLEAGAAYAAKMDAMDDLLDSMTPEEREHARKKFGQPIVLFPKDESKK